VGLLLPATAARAEPSNQEQLEKAHADLELVIEDYNRIGEELKATQAAAADLEAKMAPLQGQLDAAQADVGKLASMAYKSGGGMATIGFLLTPTTTGGVARQMESVERVARARQREVATYADNKKKYEAEKKRLDALLKAQTEQQQQIATRKTKIEAEVKRLEDVERRLEASRGGAGRGVGTGSPPPPPPTGSGKGAIAVRFAYAQLGKMYQFGADGPETFDCSGLTQQAWAAAGVSLPHNAQMQYNATAHIGRGSLIPGDLVYYHGFGHVGIFIGNGQIIHASRSGIPVKVAPLDASSPIAYSRPG
jgi:peptidoglycan DL-endopeptidase CwlO